MYGAILNLANYEDCALNRNRTPTCREVGDCKRRPYGAWPYGTVVALMPIYGHYAFFSPWSAARAREHRVDQSSLLLFTCEYV